MTMLALMFSALLAAGSAATACSPELSVDATFPQESTGTMHFAQSLAIRIGSAEPLKVQAEMLPIPGPCYRLPEQRFLVLGWSSAGSGMESIHALVVGTRAGAVVLDGQLDYTSDRPGTGLLVHPMGDDEIWLGIPEPAAGFVHQAEDWALAFGTGPQRNLSLDDIRALTFEAVAESPGDTFYAPPTQAIPRPRRVAWMTITAGGFAPAAAGRRP